MIYLSDGLYRHRRTSVAYPTVSSGLFWWSWRNYLFTDTSGTVAAATNDSIASWRSVGGSWGTDLAVQSTSSKRPTLKSDGVQSDGVDDFLNSATYNLGNFTFWCAFKIGTVASEIVWPLGQQNSASTFHGVVPNHLTNGSFILSAGSYQQKSSTSMATGTQICRIRRSGSTAYIKVYGQAEATFTDAGGGSNTISVDGLLARGGAVAGVSAFSSSAVRFLDIVGRGVNTTPGDTDDLAVIGKIQANNPGILW